MIHGWSCMLNPSVSLHAGEHLAQLVFRSENSASLWSLKAIHAMCEMEQSRVRSDLLSHPSHLCSSALYFICHLFSHHRLSVSLFSSHSLYCLRPHLIAEIKNTTLCALPHLKYIHFLCICFKSGHVFKKNFPLSDTDSLPGSVPGLVPAACEGRGGGSVQRRLLSELVSGKLLGCAH